MKINNITIGQLYKYKDLCDLLGVKCETAQNKKAELLEEFERYFEFEQPDNRHFLITKIYDESLLGLDGGYFYKTLIIPVKCSKKDYQYLMKCSRWAGDCWNELVKADNDFYKENGRLMKKGELQTFVKNLTPLHAVGNQHVYIKYETARTAMFKSRDKNRENSNKVKLPYRKKKYFVVGWNVFSYKIDYKNHEIRLAKKLDENGHQQKPVRCLFKDRKSVV